jgi:hypothetical protein
MRKLGVCAVVLSIACTSSQAEEDDLASINKTIAACIKVVHVMDKDNPFAKDFDAYYNSATGTVEYNVMFANAFARPVLFQFEKCMAQHGLPLGAKN